MHGDVTARRVSSPFGLLRALAACAILAGVLAMHALTVGHAPTTFAPPVSHQSAAHVATHASDDGARVLGESTADLCANCDDDATRQHGRDHSTLAMCLAVLAAVAVVWLVARRRLPHAHVDLTVKRLRVAPDALQPTWRTAPSLSSLCVLRT